LVLEKFKSNMAKTSVKARELKRERMVKQYAEKRAALKAAGDWRALDELPKNSSKVRLKNRCQMSGRPRGYIRYFGISRIALRDMALNGKIPGLKKASW
jgi:small subunit ribosomal protein S14